MDRFLITCTGIQGEWTRASIWSAKRAAETLAHDGPGRHVYVTDNRTKHLPPYYEVVYHADTDELVIVRAISAFRTE